MDAPDVLVIGAGPTGLMFTIELARHGLKVRIIDKNRSPSIHSKALGIQARTLEIFHHIGIIDKFLTEGIKLHGSRMISKRHQLAHLTFDAIDSPYPFLLSLEQSKTEQILRDHLSSLNIQVEGQKELVSLEQNGSSVDATFYNLASETTEIISAAWVIGCDGCHSLVRKSLKLPFKGQSLSGIFSLADVRIQWKYKEPEFIGFWDPKGLLGAIPLPGKEKYRLIFLLNRCQLALSQNEKLTHGEININSIPPPTLEEVQTLLHYYAGEDTKVSDPVWLAHFHVNSRLIDTFQKDRILLAGDAAHIHSPAGGQGMNTGIQDACNLAWKLALVHQKKAALSSLATYTIERRFVAKKILQATAGISRLATLRNPLLIQLRNWIASLLFASPKFQKKIAQAISQTAIQYPENRLILSSSLKTGPLPGLRAPNAPLLTKKGPADLFSLFKKTTCHHLLLFSGPNPSNRRVAEMKIFAKKIEDLFGSPLQSTFILQIGEVEDGIADPTGAAHQKYGATAPSAYLIRPDLYIACKSLLPNSASIETYCRNLFKG